MIQTRYLTPARPVTIVGFAALVETYQQLTIEDLIAQHLDRDACHQSMQVREVTD